MKKMMMMMMMVLTMAGNVSAAKELSKNEKIVRDFYDLAFNQFKAKEAALKYLSEEYIQHNPFVGTGRKAFIDAFEEETDDGSRAIFKRFIEEGDLVVLHSHKVSNAKDKGVAGIDIFRVKGGKITEHWDVNQKIPETSKNNNTMF